MQSVTKKGAGILFVVDVIPHIRSPERNPSLYVG